MENPRIQDSCRRLPADWQPRTIKDDHFVGISGKVALAIRRRFPLLRAAAAFTGGVLVAALLFYEINLVFSPDFWAAICG